MIQLKFENLKYPSITFSLIQINIGEGEITEIFYPHLIELGEFTLGNDDPENETLMFPGQLSVNFYFPVAKEIIDGVFHPSVSEAEYQFYKTLENIQSNGASITIYKEGQDAPFFRASFNPDDNGLIKGLISDRKIGLIFLDAFADLNEEFVIEKINGDYIYPGGGRYDKLRTFSELFKDILPVENVEFITDIRFRLATLYEFCYLPEVVVANEDFYADYLPFISSKADVFKLWLDTFASYSIIDFNRNLKILPKFYDGRNVILIKKNQIEGENHIEYGTKYEGLVVERGYIEFDNSYQFEHVEAHGKIYLTPEESNSNDPNVRQLNPKALILRIMASVGNLDKSPEYGDSRILYFITPQDTIMPIKADCVSYRQANGNYSEEKSLADWTAYLTWESVRNKARRFRAKLPGINYNFGDCFQVEGIDATFRPILFSYDMERDQTKVVIRENTNADSYINPTAVQFGKILKAFNLKLYLTKKGNVWQEYTGDAQTIHYSGQKIKLEWDNPYNCGKPSAVTYDNIGINIPNEQLTLWKDDFTIPIYIGVGNTRNTASMASDFPVANDANGKWYLLANLKDEKNPDSAAHIEYLVNGINESNPFWFWVGIKSSYAKLFDNIPWYAAW